MLLAMVADNLSRTNDVQVIQPSSWEEVDALVKQEISHILIYDFTGISESNFLALLFEHPRLILIGLDTETNRAVQFSGQETCCLTLERVKQIVLTN